MSTATATQKQSLLAAYSDFATAYDRRTRVYQGYRHRVVESLPLSTGDVVLDVGCGTGLCLPLLTERIGPTGTVVGVDQSPDMLALARQRVADHHWSNVTLIESAVEDVDVPVQPNAALFCATHDVLQSERALDRVFSHLRRGAWVGAVGGKWAPSWMVALNAMVFATHQPYVRDFDGFDRPWRKLSGYVASLRLIDVTTGYLAFGQAR
jgi:demethylmenaquinone methyltransferase/2-methoxy-6-polyprenyl-1,4-benzoquinol methylase